MWSIIESDKIAFSSYPKGISNIKRIFEQKMVGSKRFTGFGLLEVPPAGVFPQHTHPEREEIYYVLSGSGEFLIEDNEIPAREGLALYVSGDIPHGIRNQTEKSITVLFVHAQV